MSSRSVSNSDFEHVTNYFHLSPAILVRWDHSMADFFSLEDLVGREVEDLVLFVSVVYLLLNCALPWAVTSVGDFLQGICGAF